MLQTVKELISNQYEAAFCTLNACIDRCPEEMWNGKVANLAFCQAVFHTLFYADYYLSDRDDLDAFRQQAFHRENRDFFRDYEELEDRPQKLKYERSDIKRYLEYCRSKMMKRVASETTETLAAACGFGRKTFSRAELHVYNVRHIQHHGAQLQLRLRLDRQIDVPWVGSGWKDA